jgi:hypothetical protein
MDLLVQALEQTPDDSRARFLAEVVHTDAALEPLRRTPRFRALESWVERVDVARREGAVRP